MVKNKPTLRQWLCGASVFIAILLWWWGVKLEGGAESFFLFILGGLSVVWGFWILQEK